MDDDDDNGGRLCKKQRVKLRTTDKSSSVIATVREYFFIDLVGVDVDVDTDIDVDIDVDDNAGVDLDVSNNISLMRPGTYSTSPMSSIVVVVTSPSPTSHLYLCSNVCILSSASWRALM